jgi:hypothetical protein
MLTRSTASAWTVEVHDNPAGFSYVYPVQTPAEFSGDVTTVSDELRSWVRTRWLAVHGRAQYGFCHQHRDTDHRPIMVFRRAHLWYGPTGRATSAVLVRPTCGR